MITLQESLNQLLAVGPANILLLGGVLFLVASCFKGHLNTNSARAIGAMFCLAVIAVAALVFIGLKEYQSQATTLFVVDSVTVDGIKLTLFCGVLLTLLGRDHIDSRRVADYYGCFLIMLSGLAYLSAANDLLTLFLALELISIPMTVLLSISKLDAHGDEATLKYFTLASLASAIFLLGASYLYGIAGSTSLETIVGKVFEAPGNLSQVAIVLVLSGLFFRITAVPFHFYAADVFSGVTLPFTGVLAIVPKAAGILAMVRLLGGPELIADAASLVLPMLLIASGLTMTLGNLTAMAQTQGRRLLACSSISHSGYLLLALVALLTQGDRPDVLFDYLMAYSAMTIGLVAVQMGIEQTTASNKLVLSDFDSLHARNRWLALGGTICLLSLAGLPATAGFWAKFQVFIECLASQRLDVWVLTVCMAINAVIAAGYYLAIIHRFYRPTSTALTHIRPGFATSVACGAASLSTLYWFFWP